MDTDRTTIIVRHMDFFRESRDFSLIQILWFTLWSTLMILDCVLRLLIAFVERRITTHREDVAHRGLQVRPLQSVAPEIPSVQRSRSDRDRATAEEFPPEVSVRKYYAVRHGYQTEIFTSWPECNEVVKGFRGAEFRGFRSRHEAVQYLENRIRT